MLPLMTNTKWEELRRSEVLAVLRRIHVPGRETECGFKVYGYAESGEAMEYL
jgi:hypothetical protein